MFNFKTKMTENKKTEKWSSLRLDLQQFTPQEFVAGCYIVSFTCGSNGWISYDGTYNHAVSHSGGDSYSFGIKSENSPTGDQIKSFFTEISDDAVTSSSHQNENKFMRAAVSGTSFKYKGDLHFLVTFPPVASLASDPNVSG